MYHQSNLLSEIKKITQCMFSINLAQNVYLQFWVFFSVTNTMPLPLWHLHCIDLDHAWNSRHESVSRSVHPWEISKFLCRGLQAPKNCAWKWYFGWVFVTSVQLKWYNFRRQESFWGLVDIPRTCLLYASFDGGGLGIMTTNKGILSYSVINTTKFSLISRSKNTV